MANLMVFDPMRELAALRSTMDQLFDDLFTRQVDWLRGTDWMAVDMYQTDNDIVVKATIPGVKPEDVHVTVNNNVLTISGEVKQEEEVKNAVYHLRERRYGTYTRSITLPVPVEVDKAKAEYENGVLTLTLPKAEAVRPKTITVKAK